jgi:5-methylthioadenosine/S-adenosylhomocysteine deaminase
MIEKKLVIKGRYIITMDNDFNIVENGAILITGGLIEKIITSEDLPKNIENTEIIDTGNSIIMPGLINTHSHAAMCYFRGIADDLLLSEWLEKHIWPNEAKFVNPGFVENSGELAVLEMIKSGITYFSDMYFFQENLAHITQKAGIRALLGEGMLDFPVPGSENPSVSIEKTLGLIEQYRGNEFIKISLAPHTIYTLSEKYLRIISELSLEKSLPIHIHVSETEKEYYDSLKSHSLTPVGYLDKIGLFSHRVIAAHCVHLNKHDLEILKERQVKISHNPISNMKLASGAARIKEMLARGITVSLGTDGAASNNTLDLFSEMKTCSLLQKHSECDSASIRAKDIVAMATIGGAKSLGEDNVLGSLTAGKKADIITINLDKPHLSPIYDPYSHLVYSVKAGDVENVIINGKIIMKKRVVTTLDEDKILNISNSFSCKLKTSLSIKARSA